MSGQLTFPGTPRQRKRISNRRLACLGLGILLCVFTGYQVAPYKHPSRNIIPIDSAGHGGAVPMVAQIGRNGLAGSGNITPISTQLEASMETVRPDGVYTNHTAVNVNATISRKRADDLELRQSDFCTNNCNSSDIYRRLWLAARIGGNTRIFQQASEDTGDPYRESIETNVVTKEFRVIIKVLAFNRLKSLTRCLDSLAKADYGGDRVNIQIFVDHFRYSEAKRNGSYKDTDVTSEGVADSEQEAQSSESPESKKVEERGRRLLWSFFKRVPVHKAKADMHTDLTTTSKSANISDRGQGIVGGLIKDAEKTNFVNQKRNSGVEAPLIAESTANVHDKRRGVLDNASAAPRKFGMKLLNGKLEEAHEILGFVDNFWWSHGTKEIHYRNQNVGLQAQWIESWWPVDLDEFAFIVEDDMEVSNLFYRFLRTVIATYYYNPEQYDPSVYGVSLQRPRFVPGKGGLPLKVNSTKNLFLYPLVGTWGQLLFPKQWKEFRLWYDGHKSKGETPVLEGMVTNSWYKKLGEKIWTPWFVKFAHTRGYFNLYTNFVDERALSVSHREPGSNYKKAAGPDSQLIDTMEEGNLTMLWVMSPSKSLPQFDFCFRDVKTWKLARSLAELSPMLAAMEVNMSILLVNIIDVHSVLVRNWLCHMERLGLRRFVILGDDDKFTSDLARRGYATVSTELFTESETSATRFRRDMVAVQAVHGILSLDYSVWLARADTVWVQNPFDPLVVDTRGISDVMGSQPLDGFHPALLYIRASQGLLRVWSEWVGSLSVTARELKNSNSSRHMSVWLGFQDFVTSNRNCHYLVLPSGLSGSLRDLKTSETNTIASGKHVILLNGLRTRDVPEVVHTLKAAGLWTMDKDLACTRVYC